MNDQEANDYTERYVAYLDLLGFKSLVKVAETVPEERKRLLEVLKLMRDSLCQNPALGLRFTHFSDCLVLSIDRTAQGLWEAFQSIDVLTFNLLQFDVMLRGGLVAGATHHGRDFIYGTAVNQAYLLESECARDPITLVSSEVLQDAAKYGQPFLGWVREDPPGRYFIDYLRQYAEYRHEPIFAGKMIMDEPGKRIVDFVLQRLISDTGNVLAKAQWLQAYWNQTVSTGGVFDRIEPGVTPRYVSRGPTTMIRRMVAPAVPAVRPAGA
jgi:hypothetical protein